MNDDKHLKLKKGVRTAFLASILTAVLAIIKYVTGMLYNSNVLIADAFHSLADTAAILTSAFGLYLAGKAKTSKFPFGLYKAETISLLFIGLFIIYVGIDLITDGIQNILIFSEYTGIPYAPIAIVIFSIIISAFIAWWELKVSKEISSLSLEANAKESILDLMTSLIVLIGIILPRFKIPYVEGGAIILISLLVLKIGIESAYRSILILLDANVHDELKKGIEEILYKIKGIKAINGVYIREAGPFKMADLKIEISPSATIYAANDLNEEITGAIYDRLDDIEEVIIDVKPARSEIYRAVIPVKNNDGLKSIVFPHFGRSKYYAIVTISEAERKIDIEDFYLNEFLDHEKHIGLNVVKSLINFNIDIIFTSQIGEISFYILKDNLIDIYRIDKNEITLEETIDMFLDGKLKKITSPTRPASESLVNK